VNEQELQELITRADTDLDGLVSEEEFYNILVYKIKDWKWYFYFTSITRNKYFYSLYFVKNHSVIVFVSESVSYVCVYELYYLPSKSRNTYYVYFLVVISNIKTIVLVFSICLLTVNFFVQLFLFVKIERKIREDLKN